MRNLSWFKYSILEIGAVVFIALMSLGCGAVPHAACDGSKTWQCNANTVEMCNGKFWQPIQNCSDQWDAEGNSASATCTMKEDSANCAREEN